MSITGLNEVKNYVSFVIVTWQLKVAPADGNDAPIPIIDVEFGLGVLVNLIDP